MPVAFACLAISELLLVVSAGALGYLRGAGSNDRHMLMGLMALVLGCLIQIVVFTYLTVTGKMIVQAVHLGELGLHPLMEAKRLKRRMTRLLALGILPVIFVAITAGVHWRTGAHGTWHSVAALVLLTVHAGVFFVQYNAIVANGLLLDQTLGAYTQKRRVIRDAANAGMAPSAEP